ncbi:hypothetical protein C0584_01560 [Candidatus Parcubacteria bacterium]|nr:MAG: hypothetical protein C0584_01560 [Candidatus Parcubacteria bacterium]
MKYITKTLFFSLFFLLGFLSSYLINQGIKEQSYEACREEVKERFSLLDPATAERIDLKAPVKAVFGKIETIGGNEITVKIRPINAVADPELDFRDVLIGDKTQIVKYVPKNNSAAQVSEVGDEQAYEEDGYTYEKAILDINSLSAGQNVVVHSDIDIENEREFIAREIVIYEN